MSGCLYPRDNSSNLPWEAKENKLEGKTVFLNHKSQIHKNRINWRIFGFQVTIFFCSFFLMEINFLVMLHQYLPITRAGGRSWTTGALYPRNLCHIQPHLTISQDFSAAASGASAAVSSVLGAGRRSMFWLRQVDGGWEEGAWPVAALNDVQVWKWKCDQVESQPHNWPRTVECGGYHTS